MKQIYHAAAFVAVFSCLPAHAEPNPKVGAHTVLQPWVAVDGDTIKRGNLRVRAFDYDTPEIRGKCQAEKDMALKAKATLAELMAPPHKFTVRYHKGHDEFGRALGDFYSDGRRIDIDSFPAGYSRRYKKASGRQGWC